MRIALVSDIHYGQLSTTSELAVNGEKLTIGELKNAKPLFLGLMEILRLQKPDYLFIAGDLTSTGSPLEFKYCHKKICELADFVGISLNNIVVCLGNHDIDWRISKIASSYDLAPDALDDITYLKDNYRKLAHSWSIQTDGFGNSVFTNFKDAYCTPLTGVIEYDSCIVFVLNSAHLCTNDQKCMHGCLHSSQFEWLRQAAGNYQQDTRAKIVLLHHHPFNYPYPLNGLDISTLEEGSELLQFCGQTGIDLVLHGHRHHPKAKTVFETGWKKPVTFICSGSLSVNASHRLEGTIPNTFHIIDYNNSDHIILSNYYYNLSSGWSLIEKDEHRTPVDGKMRLGKIVEDSAATALIKQLPINQKIEYDTLCDDLLYLPLNKLNLLTKQVFKDDFHIFGVFPEDIIIFKS